MVKKKINLKGMIYWLILLTLILVAGTTAFSASDISGDWKIMTVQSGSMEPVIKTGSLVIVKKSNDYQKGEVITYQNSRYSKSTTTHRIVEIKEEEFTTKGDANNATDSGLVSPNLILGKLVLAIPFLGYPISFAKTLPGLIILIVIPATVIVYSEVLNIKSEISRRLDA